MTIHDSRFTIYAQKPLNLDKVDTYPLNSRHSKVTVEDFGRPVTEGASFAEFLDSLPDILAVQSLKAVAANVRQARKLNKAIIWGIGGHVVKTGLAPILIDLMERGFVTAIAANGSVLVHDSEMALAGRSSEDVDASLGSGAFGAAEETGKLLNEAAQAGAGDGLGLGEAMGRALLAMNPPHADKSLLCETYRRRVPFTAHLTIGGDIPHFHPNADGAALGATTHTDFRLLASLVANLDGGGVYLNIGSAVVMPELFLKSVTLVRNLGYPLNDFTTANFDFIQHYRPLTNVVRRPTAGSSGRGYALTGHHEIMIPLLAAAILHSRD
jgi:hypothetical protein